jgi:hypothetical protein
METAAAAGRSGAGGSGERAGELRPSRLPGNSPASRASLTQELEVGKTS